MKTSFIFTLILFVSMSVFAQYEKTAGFQFGYSKTSLIPKDSSTNTDHSLKIALETKIISAFFDWDANKPFVIHDALHMDFRLGFMSNEPRIVRQSVNDSTVEVNTSMSMNYGYLLMMGYRTSQFSVLGGIDIFAGNEHVGGLEGLFNTSTDFYLHMPLVLRGEYCFSKSNDLKRAVLMFWFDKGNEKRSSYSSIRLEIPFGSDPKWWIFGQFTSMKGIVQDNFYKQVNPVLDPNLYDGKFSQLSVGFKYWMFP